MAPRCPLHGTLAQCAGTTVPPYLVSTGQEGLISQRSGANLQERGERGWEGGCWAFLGSRNYQRSQDRRFSSFEMESLPVVSKSNESVTRFFLHFTNSASKVGTKLNPLIDGIDPQKIFRWKVPVCKICLRADWCGTV